MRRRLALVASFSLFSAVGLNMGYQHHAQAEEAPSAPSHAELAAEYWQKRSDPAMAAKAIDALEAELKANPQNVETLVRLSHAIYFHVHLQKKGGTDKSRLALLKRGTELGRQAAELDPKNPGAQFWAATNLGVYGKLDGIMKSVSSYDEIMDRLGKVSKINPDFYYGGVHRYHGRLIDQVPGMLRSMYGYDLDDALGHFQKAIDLEPNYLQSWVYLADTYLQLGEEEKAKEALTRAANHKISSSRPFAPENRIFQAEAKSLLKKHFSQ